MKPGSILAIGSVVIVVLLAAPASAIVDGQLDGSAHPFVAAVDIRSAGVPIVASGTLISPTVVVTAGHVTSYFDRAGQDRVRVTFDPVVSNSSHWYWGTLHTNPLFTTPETQDDPNDLGVIVLDAPIVGISPASLPSENLLEQFKPIDLRRSIFQEIGYGVSEHVGGPSNKGLSSYTGDGTRRVAETNGTNAHLGWLQTSPFSGHPSYGDSGGPVLMGDTVLAIHKANANGNFSTGVTFDMRLDTAEHRAFLANFLQLPDYANFAVAPVPEPASLGLFGVAVAALATRRRSRR